MTPPALRQTPVVLVRLLSRIGRPSFGGLGVAGFGTDGRRVAVGVDEARQRVGIQQRDVTGGHDDGSGEVVGECGEATADGVAGTELLVLECDDDRRQIGRVADELPDLRTAVAEHGDELGGPEPGRRMQRMPQHGFAGQLVQHLGPAGFHSGAGPSGQHDHR